MTRREAIEAVSRAFEVPVAEIVGPLKTRRIAHSRWALFKILHERGWSLSAIGKALDYDHTSVMHALKRIPDLSPEWHAAYEKARLSVGDRPGWRIVYNRPIGPPLPSRNKVNCGRPNAPVPRPPSPDELWMKLMGGRAFTSIKTTSLYQYQEGR